MGEPIELIEPAGDGDGVGLPKEADRRPRIPEPPPVRLLTVEDAALMAPAGAERSLDAFYVGLLGFERDPASVETPVYRAANFRLRFEVVEPPITRFDLRPLGVEVVSLSTVAERLLEAKVDYAWQTGVIPGIRTILLQDPAKNWVELSEASLFE